MSVLILALTEILCIFTYFEIFRVEHIPKEIKKSINGTGFKGSTITTNIFKIQAYESVMCKYICIALIYFMLESTSLTDFTNILALKIMIK